MNGNKRPGLYIEPRPDVARHIIQVLKKMGIELVHHAELKPEFLEDFFPFYLIDGKTLLEKPTEKLRELSHRAPLFVVSDYVDISLFNRCLETRVKACFDPTQLPEEMASRILASVQPMESQKWPTWREARDTCGVEHPSQISSDFLRAVFIREFLLAHGKIAALARNMGITRPTARKYFQRFRRELYAFLARVLIQSNTPPFPEAGRENALKVFKRKWLFDDFQGFFRIYGEDQQTLARILDISVDRCREFISHWQDLQLT